MNEIECKIHKWRGNRRAKQIDNILTAAHRIVIFNGAMEEAGSEQ